MGGKLMLHPIAAAAQPHPIYWKRSFALTQQLIRLRRRDFKDFEAANLAIRLHNLQ